MKKAKTLLTTLLCITLSLTISTTTLAASFCDVPDSHWAYNPVESVYAKGLIVGIGDDRFDPEATLTRTQVVQILYNAYGGNGLSDQPLGICDISEDAWYYDSVSWAALNRIAEPEDGFFYPDDPAPRWYMAEALYRIALKLGVTLPTVNEPKQFPDVAALVPNDYFTEESIATLQQAGIMSGMPSGNFEPNSSLTRCQAAKAIDLFIGVSGLEPGNVISIPEAPAPVAYDWPTLTGSFVWWDSGLYQQIIDYAAIREGVTTHVETTPDSVTIYIGAEWPSLRYNTLVFTNSSISRSCNRYIAGQSAFSDVGLTPYDALKDMRSIMDNVDWMHGEHMSTEDRSKPADVKFPWE